MDMAFNGTHMPGLGKLALRIGRHFLLLVAATVVAACSSGSDSEGGSPPPPPANQAPTANAGGDLSVDESTLVNLFGSATDPDHASNTLTFAWSQTDGPGVTLNTPDLAATSFTAPNVAAGAPQALVFDLTVTDPGGLSSTDSVTVMVQEPDAIVTISGMLQYQSPTPNSAPMCDGLDFGMLRTRPIRQVTVQLLDATGTTVLDTDISDDAGQYSFDTDASTDVMIRVRAEMIRTTGTPWNVQIRNNVIDPGSPTADPGAAALEDRPIYVMDSAVFNTGTADQNRPLTATTGWGSTSFTGPRVAAPFAILDAIYQAMQLIATEDPGAAFPPLDAYWSPDNDGDPREDRYEDTFANGNLGGISFYFRGRTQDGTDIGPSLFLLGRDGDDIEEFDDHVIVHEWGHYFEDLFSRSDSIGGSHGSGDLLDMRVAFGEGFATALSGIALDNPSYCDSLWSGGRLRGFEINTENEPTGSEDGWYSENSIIKLVYDLWDTTDDGADNDSIGFGPIYDVMVGPQASTAALTSVFSFATELKAVSGQDAFIDGLLTNYGITAAGIDIWGTNETNDSSIATVVDDVLPIYTDISLGVAERICLSSQFDPGDDGNKLSEHRYLRLRLASPQSLSFSMSTFDPPASPESDPNFRVYMAGGLFVLGNDTDANVETEAPVGNFPANTDIIITISDGRNEDDAAAGFPTQVCYDFQVN
jgi:hypothetical protein